MKIFNIENGIKKIYVQLTDIQELYKTEQIIPISILNKYTKELNNHKKQNKHKFIEFNKEEEINFFKAIDWIVDGKELNKKSIKELDKIYKKSIKDIYYFINIHNINNLSEDEKCEYEILKYKSESIKNYFLAKYGDLNIPFPEVPNNEKVILDDRVNSGIIISESLNPNSIVMTKKNGEKFNIKESVNIILINKALDKIKKKRKSSEDHLFKYKRSFDISDDLKHLIIRYRIGTYKDNQVIINKKSNEKLLIKK